VRDVQIEITGPPQRVVGESAEIMITVTNTGQAALGDVQIAFYTEPSLLARRASLGYDYREGGLHWNLGTLQPNQAQSRTVQCQAQRGDPEAEIRVTLSTAEGISRTKTVSLEIREAEARPQQPSGQLPADAGPLSPDALPGSPRSGSLRLSVADTADPIRVGGTTTYIVQIENDRPAEDKNVVVMFFLPDGLDFVGLDNSGLTLPVQRSPNGRTVAVSPIRELRAGEKLRAMRVNVRATAPGVQRFRVEVTSLRSPQPVTADHQTTVQAN
jgi:uncharacterized repeat protein (TIGR01451 family)